MKKGPYKVVSSKIAYKNPWIKIIEEKIEKRGGKPGFYGVIDYGKGVSTVALDDLKNIYLVKEYYYAIEQYALQTPSGAIDKGETALNGAKKELLEETGLRSDNWIELGYVNPLTMILKSPAYLFLALNVEKVGVPEDDIEVVKMPFEKAYEMVLNSEITHAPSCVAILKAKIHLNKK